MRKLLKLTKQEFAIANAVAAMQSFTRAEYQHAGKKEATKKVETSDAFYYEFIPNSSDRVLDDMFRVNKLLERKREDRTLRFLDVGSGVGNILGLANIVKWDRRGVEFDEDYKKISSWNVKDCTEYIDALDYKKYGHYDIIYFYQPIVTHTVMNKLLDIIDSQIKKGTIIMCYPACHQVEDKVRDLWEQVFDRGYNIRIKK